MDLESACQLTSQLGKMEMKELGVSEFEKDVAVVSKPRAAARAWVTAEAVRWLRLIKHSSYYNYY